jgi:hypothetical protein
MAPSRKPVTSRERCTAHKTDGSRCGRWPSHGSTVCKVHGAGAPQVAAKAAVRAELMAWRLGDMLDDPGETLLRLLTQSRRRAEVLGMALEELVAQHDGDLLAALTDDITVSTEFGSYKAGEYTRELVKLEERERDRLAHFAKLAIDAKLGEKAIEIAQQQGAQIAVLLRAVLADPDLGLSLEQRRAVPGVARRVLELVGS